MRLLRPFKPRLVGSVWRGTARNGSDVDILVYFDDHRPILKALQSRYKILRVEWRSKVEGGDVGRHFHIYVSLPSGSLAEVVVRSPGDKGRAYKCEIYGDTITGLTVDELKEVLERDPLKRFVPRRATA
ncbi:MAG: nucleotidyltransferase domain-containing protein [Candidatus Bathyarchaeia archaeon]